jgi:type I secretion membrane fusion protein, HlyD family
MSGLTQPHVDRTPPEGGAAPLQTVPASSEVTVPVPLPAPHTRPVAPLRRDLRWCARVGLLVIVLFFVVGGGWAALAPIGGAVIAAGVVSPEGSRRTVQHLEGGIIREINVREGDQVKEGDVLMVLEDVSARAEVGTLRSRLRSLAAIEARLTAERNNDKAITFVHPSLADRDDPEVSAVVDQQINQFEARRSNDAGREEILAQRIAQLDQQIVGAQRQLTGVRRQNELIREEIATVAELLEKGYEKKPRLLALQRTEAELVGEEGDLVSRVARSREQIGETKLQIMNIRQQRLEDIDKELAETQAKRNEVEEQIRDSRDKLRRKVIEAPVDGTILTVKLKTIGGVVRPGEPVIDIVPLHEDLIIDGRISPNDVDDVHTGQHAFVMFPSFSQRIVYKLDGRVERVSADAMTDEKSGRSYFTVKIHVDRDEIERLDPEIELGPGMPAEAFISTTPRTLLEYLVQPLSIVLERSFREH